MVAHQGGRASLAVVFDGSDGFDGESVTCAHAFERVDIAATAFPKAEVVTHDHDGCAQPFGDDLRGERLGCGVREQIGEGQDEDDVNAETRRLP
nr:hypothetical protein [Streptomyces dengpaensis]